jgi:hypothetical protein
MPTAFRKGASLRTLVGGQYRDVVIDHVTSNGRLAQCYWLQGGTKRYVAVSLPAEARAEHPIRSRSAA